MRRLILFAILLWQQQIHAQELSYKKYGVKEGMAGSIVYHCLQDNKGYIWFATNHGVSRFDGKDFRNFSKEDGLPDNEILKLYIDKHDNVWFTSWMGVPSVFFNGAIRQIPCKDVVAIAENVVDDSIVFISKYSPSLGYYRSLNKPGHWQFFTHFGTPATIHSKYWPILRASSPAGINFYYSRADGIKNRLLVKTAVEEKSFFFASRREFSPFVPYSFVTVAANKKAVVFNTTDSMFYADANRLNPLFCLQDIGLNKDAENDVVSLFCEDDSTLWLCTKNKGLIRVQDFRKKDRRFRYFFAKDYCSSILKDREGGYWITTLNDGVYYIPNLSFFNLVSYPGLTNSSVKCIKPLDKKRLVAGFADGTILTIYLDDLKKDTIPNWSAQNKNNRVLDLAPYPGNRLLAATDGGLYMLSPGHGYSRLNPGMHGIKGVYVKPDSTFLVATGTDLELLDLRKQGYKALFNSRVTSVTCIGDNYFWGTLKGPYGLIKDSLIVFGERYPVLNGVINHIDVAPDSALWFSMQEGVVILKNEITYTIGKNEGLLSNKCKHVLFDASTAWISTDQGVSRVDYRWERGRLSYHISNIREADGLTSTDVNQTALAGDYIWTATETGIGFFPKNYTGSAYSLPTVKISGIKTGNTEQPVSDTIIVNYKKNSLLLYLFCPSYRSAGSIYYEYRINHLDSNWRTTVNNYIEFSSLPFGEFVLEVNAFNKWGQKSGAPKTIRIINQPPFWKTTWFLVLVYIITILLIAAIFYWFNRSRHLKKEKSYLQAKKMHELEIMALRAQMNPHFIFNCLSSIQHYILRADVINANLYLHKFSTLVRKILQYSNVSMISLAEEIKLLELYLELEKMRLKDRMDFEIVIPPGIQTENVYLPPMIIQPYIENAIKHGISPLVDKKGSIVLSFALRDGYIHCFIEDNGIGISASGQNGYSADNEYTSMGNSITENRINTINSMQKNKILLRIKDRRESGAEESGTAVQISFPLANE